MKPPNSHVADALFQPVKPSPDEGKSRPRVRSKGTVKRPGNRLKLAEVEPWPEPVDGQDLLHELTYCLRKHVVLPEPSIDAIALWVVHAHAHGAAFVSPVLALSSPQKRCGKTTTLYLLEALTPKPLSCSNISEAALFRSVDEAKPTVLIDEADTFLHERRELVGILNSGHTRQGKVARIEGDGANRETRVFSTWAPKAIALIRSLPSTLEDRSIKIVLHRKRPDSVAFRLRLDRLADFEPVRRRACRWAVDHMDILIGADPVVPDGLHDRAADNWRPLLAIAEAVGGKWPDAARRAARQISGHSSDFEDELSTELLRDIRTLVRDLGTDRVASRWITENLVFMEGRPWAECVHGKPLTQNRLAWYLRPFEIQPESVRFEDGTRKGYLVADFAEAFTRYLSDGTEQAEQASNDEPDAAIRGPELTPVVSVSQHAPDPHASNSVPEVPVRPPHLVGTVDPEAGGGHRE
jgi:hypothetical protein